MTQTIPSATNPMHPPAAPPRIPAWASYRPPHQEIRAPKARAPRHGGGRPRAGLLALALGIGLVLVLLVASVALLATEVGDLNDQLDTQVRASADAQQELTEQIDSATAAANGLSERLGDLEARVDDQPDLAKVAGQVEPSVFTVVAGSSQGSAFVFQRPGARSVLITNFHVIQEIHDQGGRRVDVAQDNRRLAATIERVNPDEDLAVLGVDAELPVLKRSTNEPAVGDPVLAFGSPLGLGGSASNGIVSALRPGRIQFSAPVSPGNSGGPLVDRRGEVIGVTTSKLVGRGSEGISFAIPISRVCSTVVSC